ncbi:hypothetical protein SAPIO_CDS1159 [Scedosporium apiospermum]|uniref:Protein disulfide-isomerase n=1 Tax=Pseudallescheria apiosperma TaxID=563466 RepID=A0A084GFZ7_PSEDA|nr:uncharacterized protein SAPIO_CDS1159 [Scedosporium apiospermum]KEZ46259.1 hypothetical protein SAPIO_CDS1159 [Scedosporium apiospermum]
MMTSNNYRRLLFCAGAIAVSPTLGWTFTKPHDLDIAISRDESTLIAFVMPELASCKKLESEWELVEKKHPRTAVVDCGENAEYCFKQDVLTHPTVRVYFPDNTMERYRGPRKADPILSFVKRIHRPILPVTDKNETAFLNSDEVVIIGRLPPLTEEPESELLHKRFAAVAHRYRDRYTFGIQTITGDSSSASLKCQNNIDGLGHDTPDLTRVPAMESFVKICGTPLVGELSRRTELSLVKASKSMVHYFTDSEEDKEAYIAAIRPLAQKYREYLNFVTIDVNEYPDMTTSVGHRKGASRVVAVQNPHTWQAYPLEEGSEVSAASVEQFILAITQNKVAPWDGTPKEDKLVETADEGVGEVEEQEEGETNASHDEL